MTRWPPLGWIACLNTKDRSYRLLYGKHVEVWADGLIEGVWDGDFEQGDFDRTAQIYGSGLRRRGGSLTFVSPGTTTERLWYAGAAGQIYVANSLPLLLAISGYRLRDDVPDYAARATLMSADPAHDTTIPAHPHPVHVVYHHNLVISDQSFPERVPKPATMPVFTSFEEYSTFLYSTVESLATNARDSRRRHRIELLATVSSGYDSPAAAVLARAVGCRRAATIGRARSALPRSDSGAEIARQLGLSCEVVPRGGRGGEHELTFWAALGHPQDEHFAALDYPAPICLLFTGQYGGGIWTMEPGAFRSPFQRSDWSGLGLGEYRLVASVIHCPVPFLGAERYEAIWAISHSEAMRPWMRHGDYDRPIPRRLVEEAGVDGGSFGIRKSATSYDDSFVWPTREDLAADYRRFLRSRAISPPPVSLARAANVLYQNILFPAYQKLRPKARPRRFWLRAQQPLFVWANHALASRYAQAYREAREGKARSAPTSPSSAPTTTNAAASTIRDHRTGALRSRAESP